MSNAVYRGIDLRKQGVPDDPHYPLKLQGAPDDPHYPLKLQGVPQEDQK